MSPPVKSGPRASRAGALLRYHGASQAEVATKINRSQPSVANVLAGRQALQPAFAAALVELVGQDAAADIIAAIPSREAVAA